MKYSFLINQVGIVEAGLADKTDFNDWAILEYIAAWQNHSAAFRINNHVWLDYQHLLREMPMLSVRTKSGVSARIKRLKECKLLVSFLNEERRVFVRVTDFYLSVVDFRPSNTRPISDAGAVHLCEHPVHENEHPVHTDEHLLNNKVLNNKNNTLLLEKSYPQEEEKEIDEQEPDDLVFTQPLQWAQFFIRECGYPLHIVQTSKTVPMFAQWITDKVPIADMRLAMLACHSWNGERVPDSPILYKKFLQSVQDEKRRLAEEGEFAKRGGSGKTKKEDWEKVPRVDESLVSWAKKHGFPDAGKTMTYFDYRGFLYDKVNERKNSDMQKKTAK